VVGLKLRFDNVTTVTWMVPVIVLGIPIFDTTLVTFSRLRRGLNPLTTPGKDHLSHRLVKLGLTHREAVLTIYVVGVALGLIATLLTRASPLEAYAVLAVLLAAGLFALVKLEAIYSRPTG
jgi:UDP-GlcNAc:undecaprenyl-phosphate GlcNAc-1-phosphate transferase